MALQLPLREQAGSVRGSKIAVLAETVPNPAVIRPVEDMIRRARACGRKIGNCGQAPSDYPEFTRVRVSCAIDSILPNPATVLKTAREIVEAEQELATRAPRP
jgi:pyruvate,water dikinase